MGCLELQLQTQSRLVLLFDRDKNQVPLGKKSRSNQVIETNKFGRTFATSWTQRCCSYQLVTILRAVKKVVAAILSTAEKCEIFHRS